LWSGLVESVVGDLGGGKPVWTGGGGGVGEEGIGRVGVGWLVVDRRVVQVWGGCCGTQVGMEGGESAVVWCVRTAGECGAWGGLLFCWGAGVGRGLG